MYRVAFDLISLGILTEICKCKHHHGVIEETERNV